MNFSFVTVRSIPGLSNHRRPGVFSTPKRHEFRQDLPYPEEQRRLPSLFRIEEVSRLINAAGNLTQGAFKCSCTAPECGTKEIFLLKIGDIDSLRMILRGECREGGHDRDLPLSPALPETLRGYRKWKVPRRYLFASGERHPRKSIHLGQGGLVRLHRGRVTPASQSAPPQLGCC